MQIGIILLGKEPLKVKVATNGAPFVNGFNTKIALFNQ